MSKTELNFAHCIQVLLNSITLPEHRQIVAEVNLLYFNLEKYICYEYIYS